MLTGKAALVTGAGRGIGKEIALTLAKEGADIALNYNGSKEAAEETAMQIEGIGRKVILLPCNVSDFQACGAMVEQAEKEFGKIDILVNNAGITKDNLLLRMTEEEFNMVLDVNLKGSFYTIRHITKQMLKRRYGRIINLSSISGVIGNVGQANYCASKAGIIGLTKSAARELASRNITVNAIAPGFIDTDMTAVLSDNVKEGILAQIPMRRFGSVKDIAETAAFLASDKAAYITGQVIQVNGGMAM
ncbi:MAG: 3-oxoacyl-[acyl-carrier-protein] reductase [Lachnospiraceae bacterium]|nr:3-oxoacyl-[acyl-carrier-protein] reductase [Lachnospiraceae bacterium]